MLPWPYLKGIGTGDFSEALQTILGPDAPGLSATTITRRKATWEDRFAAWNKRSPTGEHYVYVWADGVPVALRDLRCREPYRWRLFMRYQVDPRTRR